jgi:hypothetical protein
MHLETRFGTFKLFMKQLISKYFILVDGAVL